MALARYVLNPGEDPFFQIKFYGPYARAEVLKVDWELAKDLKFADEQMFPSKRRKGKKSDFKFALKEVDQAIELLKRQPRTKRARRLLGLLREAIRKAIMLL